MRLRCLSCGAQGDHDGPPPGTWFRLTCACCSQVNRFQSPAPEEEWRLLRGILPLSSGASEPWQSEPQLAAPAPETKRPDWLQGLESYAPFAVLDGANIAHLHEVKGRPTLFPIEAALGKLQAFGYETHVWVDASLWGRLGDKSLRNKLDEYLETDGWSQAPKGVEADKPILEEADQRRGVVVSNDAFRDYELAFPWLVDEPRRILRPYLASNLDLRFASSRQAADQAHRRETRARMGRPELDRMLLNAWQHSTVAGQEYALRVSMAQSLEQTAPGFDVASYGYSKFTDFLLAQDHLFRFESVRRPGEPVPHQIRVWLRDA